MTTPDTKAIRAQMEALAGLNAGPSVYHSDLPSVEPNWHIVTTDNNARMLANVHIEPGNAMDAANASLISATTHMRETILALCDAMEAERAENVRLRAALQPFADYMHTDEGRLDLDHNGCELPDDLGVGWIYLNHGDFRRAQAALAQEGGE